MAKCSQLTPMPFKGLKNFTTTTTTTAAAAAAAAACTLTC